MPYFTIKNIRLCCFLLILSIFCSFCYADESDDEGYDNEIVTKLSKDTIKIGQKATLTTKIKNLPDMKALWQDLSKSIAEFEVISSKDYYEHNALVLEIVFTSFEPKEYKDLYFTIPLKDSEGQVVYMETKRFDLSVFGEVSQEDLDNMVKMIQKEEDLNNIKAKQVKSQEKFRYNFKPYIKWVVFFVIMLLACSIAFYFLYQYVFKNKKMAKNTVQVSPFESFVANMELVSFNEGDDRKDVEKNLSLLTESLKCLLAGEMSSKANCETTRELVIALKKANVNGDWITLINRVFSSIDMIIFAKSAYTIDQLSGYKNEIKQLGYDVHDAYKLQNGQEEDKK